MLPFVPCNDAYNQCVAELAKYTSAPFVPKSRISLPEPTLIPYELRQQPRYFLRPRKIDINRELKKQNRSQGQQINRLTNKVSGLEEKNIRLKQNAKQDES